MKSKEEILRHYGSDRPTSTGIVVDWNDAIKAMQEYADQETAELRRQVEELKEQNRKLNFMIDNGLGDRDMKNDI